MSVTPEEFHSALKNSYLNKLSEKAKENLCKTAFKFVFNYLMEMRKQIEIGKVLSDYLMP